MIRLGNPQTGVGELLRAIKSLELSADPRGAEVFIKVTPEGEEAVREGQLLYPTSIHIDEEGDLILTVTSNEDKLKE